MKSIGIKIGVLLAILLFSIASFANKGTQLTVDQRATLRMQKINSVCTLTPQQQVQVKQLYVISLNNQKSYEALKANKKGLDKASRKAASKTRKQQNRVDLKTVLTPTQLSKWKARN
jgi:MFS superfamily sulfate permease-like transporter